MADKNATQTTVPQDQPTPVNFQEMAPDALFGKASKPSTSKYTERLKASYGENGGEKLIQFVVPTDQSKKEMQAVRSEAGRLGLGVVVRFRDNPEDKTTTVQFLAREKQTRNS